MLEFMSTSWTVSLGLRPWLPPSCQLIQKYRRSVWVWEQDHTSVACWRWARDFMTPFSFPSQPSALQLVLLIPEGTDIVTLPSLPRDPCSEHTTTGEVRGVPNCYLVCKLFCATPHPTTPVQWASSNPQFQFRQVTYCVLVTYSRKLLRGF